MPTAQKKHKKKFQKKAYIECIKGDVQANNKNDRK